MKNMKKNKSSFSGPEFTLKKSFGGYSNIFKKILIAVLVGFIIAVFISLVFRIWDPLWNPFRPSPNEVLLEVSKNIENVDSFNRKGSFSLGVYPEEEVETRISFNFSGKTEVSHPIKYSGEIEAGGFFPQKGNVSWNMENVISNGSHYVKFKVPSYLRSFLESYEMDFEKLTKNWIKINGNSEKDILFEKIKSVFKEEKYEIEKELKDKAINEINVYHYYLSLDSELVKESLHIFWENLMNISENMEIDFEVMDDFLKETEKIYFEIWIGKENMNIYRIRSEKEMDMSKVLPEKGGVKTKFEINYSNFNKELEIIPPEDYIDFKEVFDF